ETGSVTVPTADERQGNFDLGSFETTDSSGNPVPTTVDGAYWAQVLSTRLGYAVTQGESYAEVQVPDSSPLGYHLAFCTNNAQCVFPNGALPQSAWAAPATAILSYIPAPTTSRAPQFVMSNAKSLGGTAVNEARISFFRTALHKDNPAGSFASLSSLGFITGAGTLGIVPLPGYKQYVPQITLKSIGLN